MGDDDRRSRHDRRAWWASEGDEAAHCHPRHARGHAHQDHRAWGHRSVCDMEHDPAHQSRGGHLTRPRRLSRSGGERGGEAGGERHVAPTQGGVQHTRGVGVQHPTLPLCAVGVRVFRPRPCDPIRASGEGKYGSDPPLSTAGADRRRGGCNTGCNTRCNTPPQPSWGSLPSVYIPAGRLPAPHAGRATTADGGRDV